MAREIVGQLHPLLIVWLLLTLPVVCHHETAVVVLGAVAGGASQALGAGHMASHRGAAVAGTGHAHGQPTSGGHDHARVDLTTAATPAAPGGPEWCAHQPDSGAIGLPAGQDSVAALGELPLPIGPSRTEKASLRDPASPLSTPSVPPAPPPRFTI